MPLTQPSGVSGFEHRQHQCAHTQWVSGFCFFLIACACVFLPLSFFASISDNHSVFYCLSHRGTNRVPSPLPPSGPALPLSTSASISDDAVFYSLLQLCFICSVSQGHRQTSLSLTPLRTSSPSVHLCFDLRSPQRPLSHTQPSILSTNQVVSTVWWQQQQQKHQQQQQQQQSQQIVGRIVRRYVCV